MVQTIETLRKLGVSSAQIRRCLMDAALHSDARVRERALDSLLSIEPGTPRDIALLQTALSDEDQGVRRIAVAHLRNVGEAETLRPLALAMRDTDSWIRNQALLAIQEIGRGKSANEAFSEAFTSSGLLDQLQELLVHGEANDRTEAANALAAVGTTGLEVLTELLCTDAPDVKMSAAEALIQGGVAARPFVEREYDKVGGSSRIAAAYALATFGGPRASEALDVLISDLSSPEAIRRRFALQAIRNIGPGAARALAAVVERLNDEDRQVRLTAAYALLEMRIEPPSATPALLVAVRKEPDPETRFDMATILWQISPSQDEPVLAAAINALSQNNADLHERTARVLTVLGPKASSAVPALIDARERHRRGSHDPYYVRARLSRVFVDALQAIGTEEALAALMH